MSQTEHTPWNVQQIPVNPAGRHTYIIRDVRNYALAEVGHIDAIFTDEELLAIARLIAAAPGTAAERDRLREINGKLLAACKAACRMLCVKYSIEQLKESVDWAIIEAAIAETTKEG
jgi:hypothetical protein